MSRFGSSLARILNREAFNERVEIRFWLDGFNFKDLERVAANVKHMIVQISLSQRDSTVGAMSSRFALGVCV